ncbi:MAG: DUF899 family protein, partial [Planctomycetes bacterium]|nr:DUF899 family protein [Planctomycetota bacterium]
MDHEGTELGKLWEEQQALNARWKAAWEAFKPEPVEDYSFERNDGSPVKLSELFGEHKRLLVIHNMGFHCPYCTLWADGFSGTDYFYHKQGIGFVLSSPDTPEQQAEGKAKRGWTFPLVSNGANTFAKDM